MDVRLNHDSLKIDVHSPFFYKDGDKWVVEESKNFSILSAIPNAIQDIKVEGDNTSHHVLIFNCVVQRKTGNTWGENETARIAQSIDDSVVYKGGSFFRISSVLFLRIASRIH